MGGDDTTKRKRRSNTEWEILSLEAVPLPFVHDSKRSKPLPPKRSTSEVKNTNLDDLPDVVLIQILCRLPCLQFLFKCKSVCKRWNILMSDPYFIGRCLSRLQSQNTPIPKLTLINQKGEKSSFAIASNPPTPKFLTKLFLRLMFSLSLKREPVVVGACNDLVLCCATEYFQRDYFVCNPYTNQWVALPPVSRVIRDAPVGFICDPYYDYPKKDKPEVHQLRNDQPININVDYRCMVVRILPYDNTYEHEDSNRFKVEIFSFAVGEWRESIISFPKKFRLDDIYSSVHYTHSEMMYWSSIWPGGAGHTYSDQFLIGLNAFMISDVNNNNIIRTSSSSSNSEDSHQCRYIELIVKDPKYDKNCCLNQIQSGVVPRAGGCLQMCVVDSNNSAYIWELKKEEDDLTIAADGFGKLYARHLSLHSDMRLICLDPNNEGYMYVGLSRTQIKVINLHSGLSHKMNIPENDRIFSNFCFFPLTEKPWWPTPVSRLPHRSIT